MPHQKRKPLLRGCAESFYKTRAEGHVFRLMMSLVTRGNWSLRWNLWIGGPQQTPASKSNPTSKGLYLLLLVGLLDREPLLEQAHNKAIASSIAYTITSFSYKTCALRDKGPCQVQLKRSAQALVDIVPFRTLIGLVTHCFCVGIYVNRGHTLVSGNLSSSLTRFDQLDKGSFP